MSRLHFLDRMTHPLVIGSVLLLIVNDHLLKKVWPSWATGKLSDLAAMVFFPILVSALLELTVPALRSRRNLVLAATVVLTALAFAGMKLSAQVGDVYRDLMGLAQWPFRLIADPRASLATVTMTPDATDLFVLPVLAIAWWIGTSEPAMRRMAVLSTQE